MGRRDKELRIYGLNAARAVLAKRPEEILRAYATEPLRPGVGAILERCAHLRRPYRLVPAEELETIAESRHHEGVCLVVERREASLDAWLEGLAGSAKVLLLDRVANPHNLGAILRSAAHFGVAAVVLADDDVRLGGAAARTAEGGAEWVALVRAPSLRHAVERLREAGFKVLATSGRARRSLHAPDLALGERVAVLLGSEGEGLARGLAEAADDTVAIPGTGHVESLNVSVAAAVVLAELARRSLPEASRGRAPSAGAAPHREPRGRSRR
jgi:TrmH RNA methyltransferase